MSEQTTEHVLQITLNLMGQREHLIKAMTDEGCCEVMAGDQIEAVDKLITHLMSLIQVVNSSQQKDI